MEYLVLATLAIFVVAIILVVMKPWKNMDLSSREEVDDEVKSPAHPTVQEAVEEIIKAKKVNRVRKKVAKPVATNTPKKSVVKEKLETK